MLVDFSMALAGPSTVLKEVCEMWLLFQFSILCVHYCVISLFLGGCRQISQAFYQLPFTIYACMQELCVCYFWMVFKKIFGIILYFLLIALFGSVNRLPHYLVSLTLSILFVYLKQVMDNNYYLEAGSICLRVKLNWFSDWSKDTFYRKCLALSSSLPFSSL